MGALRQGEAGAGVLTLPAEEAASIPEVTAAAGRHRGLANYRVARIGQDEFDVEDDEGTRGSYRVLERDGLRRVVVVRARRRMRVLGDVSGAMLARLTLVPDTRDGKPATVPRIESVVRIDHRVVAAVEREWYAPTAQPDGALRDTLEAITTSLQHNAPLDLRSRLFPRSALPPWRTTP